MIKNPNITWKDVDASLPNTKIEVLGPPPTSGTRDAFAELAMEGGCKTFKWLKDLKKENKKCAGGLQEALELQKYCSGGLQEALELQK